MSGTRNKLDDLNDHLFAQLERISDDDLTDDEIKIESDRTKSISIITDRIIQTGRLQLDATKYYNETMLPANQAKLPNVIGINQDG